MPPPILQTARLLLGRFEPAHLDALAAMGRDPAVMRFFPSLMSEEESHAMATRVNASIEEHGFGFFAATERSTGTLVGLVGMQWPRFELPFQAQVEIGWRLAPPFWGQGMATEAAAATLDLAFGEAGLDEVLSMTAVLNEPSAKVMQRLGMTRDPAEDFDHPAVPEGSPLRRHVLYRITKAQWARQSP